MRSRRQFGKKGRSNRRWVAGSELCFVLSHLGLIVDWEVATANVYDDCAFQQVVERNTAQMVLFSDEGFAKKDGIRKTSRSASGASGIPA